MLTCGGIPDYGLGCGGFLFQAASKSLVTLPNKDQSSPLRFSPKNLSMHSDLKPETPGRP